MFKVNISDKDGKTYKIELEDEEKLLEKELHEKIPGELVSDNLEGYELEITGLSDKSGFTALARVPGMGLKKVLLSYEKGMKKRPKKEGKRKRSDKTPKGLRLRKTVRGKAISSAINQINMIVSKEGSKKLSEIFKKEEPVAEEPKK